MSARQVCQLGVETEPPAQWKAIAVPSSFLRTRVKIRYWPETGWMQPSKLALRGCTTWPNATCGAIVLCLPRCGDIVMRGWKWGRAFEALSVPADIRS